MYWKYRERIFWTSSCVLCREAVLVSEHPLSEIPLYFLTRLHPTHTYMHVYAHLFCCILTVFVSPSSRQTFDSSELHTVRVALLS